MLEIIVKSSSFLFLAGVLLVFLSAVPRFREAWPRAFLLGFALSAGSVLLVAFAALLLG